MLFVYYRRCSCLTVALTLKWRRYFPTRWCLRGFLRNPLQKTTFPVEFPDKNRTIDRVCQTIIISEKSWKKVYRFKMEAILMIFLPRDCAIPRKLEKHFPEKEFQRNVAQSRSLIETHNRNKILKFVLLRDFTGKIVFCHESKYADLS